MNKIIIIGASKDKSKFGNKAVRAYLSKGYNVFPINPKEDEIEGIKCYKSLKELPEHVEIASMYLPPSIGINIIDKLAQVGVRQIYLNPGTESDEIISKLKKLGVEPLMVCSIVAIGINPSEL